MATPTMTQQGVLASTTPKLQKLPECLLAPAGHLSLGSPGLLWMRKQVWAQPGGRKGQGTQSSMAPYALVGHIGHVTSWASPEPRPYRTHLPPQPLSHHVHSPPRPQTVLTGLHHGGGCFVWMVRHFG